MKEQAAIARAVGIAKRTELPAMLDPNDTALYLRGYEVIEKEISLVNSRRNKLAFIEGLVELEREKLMVLQDKKAVRSKQFFEQTPIFTDPNFAPVSFMIDQTVFEYQNTRNLKLILALISGLSLSLSYVLVSGALHKRKNENQL